MYNYSMNFTDFQSVINARWLNAIDSAITNGVFNVKHDAYGALGNGVSDDTLAIQKAIDDASEFGGLVYFPYGTYVHTGLTINRNVVLMGADGAKCSLFLKSGSNTHSFTITQATGVVQAPTFVQLTVDGNRSGNLSSGSCLYLPDSAELDATIFYGFGVNLKDCYIINARDACLYVGRNRNMGDVYNTEFKRGARCVYINASSDWRFFHPRLASPLAGHALHIDSGADNTFLGGAAYGALNGYACVKIESTGSQNTKFQAMTVNFNQNEGIWVKGPTGVARHMGVTIEGCWFDQNGLAADNTYPHIKMEDTQGNSVIGNTIRYVGGGIKTNFLVQFVGTTGPIEWVGNSYDSVTNVPYGTGVSNNNDLLRARLQRLVVENESSLGGIPGGQALRVPSTGVTSSNFVQIEGGATGTTARISAQGVDSNVILRVSSKANAAVEFLTQGVRQARVMPVASAVNYLDFYGSATGGNTQIAANGTDTNVNLQLTPRGTGTIVVPIAHIRDFADDTAAAAGGVPVGGFYRTASVLKIRVT